MSESFQNPVVPAITHSEPVHPEPKPMTDPPAVKSKVPDPPKYVGNVPAPEPNAVVEDFVPDHGKKAEHKGHNLGTGFEKAGSNPKHDLGK